MQQTPSSDRLTITPSRNGSRTPINVVNHAPSAISMPRNSGSQVMVGPSTAASLPFQSFKYVFFFILYSYIFILTKCIQIYYSLENKQYKQIYEAQLQDSHGVFCYFIPIFLKILSINIKLHVFRKTAGFYGGGMSFEVSHLFLLVGSSIFSAL